MIRRDAAYCTSRLNIAQLSSLYKLNEFNARNETIKNHLQQIIPQPSAIDQQLTRYVCHFVLCI